MNGRKSDIIDTDDPLLCRVWMPYAVFGIIVVRRTVRNAAPIGRWMVGKDYITVASWAESKGGNIENLGLDPMKGMPHYETRHH